MAPRMNNNLGNHNTETASNTPTASTSAAGAESSGPNGTLSSSSSAMNTAVSRSSSQAEAVAVLVEASSNHTNSNDDDHRDDHDNKAAATTTTTPPSTPPRIPKPQSPVRQESALKRLSLSLRKARRSLSAPPALRRRRQRRQQTRLIEEHFLVIHPQDGENRGDSSNCRNLPVVLPGVLRHEENWARDLHDFFNLVVLVPVVALNIMNWNWDLLLHNHNNSNNNSIHHHKLESLGDAWTGEYYYAFFCVTALYFLTDLLWMFIEPTCVRSPTVIIQHHVATLLYIFIPYRIPHVRWCMGACMSVEVNTWLLIARRVFNKQGFPPWTIVDLSFVSIRVKLISIFFYITWIGIRCILYPYLLSDIWNLYYDYSNNHVKTYWNLLLICFPLHAIFCLLNLKWTYDLLMSKIRYWQGRGIYNSAEDDAKDKGL